MRDLRAYAEMRALIGAGGLRQLEGTRSGYRCWRCGRKGRATKPTSVIVVRRVIKLTQAGCAGSHIIDAGAAGRGQRPANGRTDTLPARPGREPTGPLRGQLTGGGAWHDRDAAGAQAGPGS